MAVESVPLSVGHGRGASWPGMLAIAVLLRYVRTRSLRRSSWPTGSSSRRSSSSSGCAASRLDGGAHGGHEAAPPAGDPRPRGAAPDPHPAGAGRRPPRARLPHDPGDDQPRRRRAGARSRSAATGPRPTRCRRGCVEAETSAARTGCASSCATCRSRSARRACCSSSGRCPGSAHADRGRAGPRPLAGGRGLDRRRRHGLRGVRRPGLDGPALRTAPRLRRTPPRRRFDTRSPPSSIRAG